MTTIAFTGHRPKDLGRITEADVHRVLDRLLADSHDIRFVTGGALGIDMWAAQYAYNHSIPFTLILPFRPSVMTKYWTDHDRDRLYGQINDASDVQIVLDDGTFQSWAYQRRNEEMVNRADLVYAVWSGKTEGGTYNCVRYVEQVGKPMLNMYRLLTR